MEKKNMSFVSNFMLIKIVRLTYFKIIYSFNFSNRFILVRVTVDLQPIPGTLDVRGDKLDGMPNHSRAPCIHTFTRRVNLRVASAPLGGFWEVEETGETEGIPHRQGENLQ